MTAGVMCAVAVRCEDFTDDFDTGRATLILTRVLTTRARAKTFSVAQLPPFSRICGFRIFQIASVLCIEIESKKTFSENAKIMPCSLFYDVYGDECQK